MKQWLPVAPTPDASVIATSTNPESCYYPYLPIPDSEPSSSSNAERTFSNAAKGALSPHLFPGRRLARFLSTRVFDKAQKEYRSLPLAEAADCSPDLSHLLTGQHMFLGRTLTLGSHSLASSISTALVRVACQSCIRRFRQWSFCRLMACASARSSHSTRHESSTSCGTPSGNSPESASQLDPRRALRPAETGRSRAVGSQR